MAEAEDVITDAALHVAGAVSRQWQRRQQRDTPYEYSLDAYRARLDILLRTLLQCQFSLRNAAPAPRPPWVRRLFSGYSARFWPARALPGHDGLAIALPRALGADDSTLPAELRYRVMALQQAQRCLRRARAGVIDLRDDTVRCLFLLAEAAQADLELAQRFRGLRADLQCARGDALRRRPALAALNGRARELENLYRQLLGADAAQLPAAFARGATPAESLQWAHARAQQIAAEHAPATLLQRARWFDARRAAGLIPDEWLGVWMAADDSGFTARAAEPENAREEAPARSAELARRPRARALQPDEDNDSDGFWMVQPTPPSEHVEDPFGMQRPADREQQADLQGMGESLAELDELGVVSSPQRAREILQGEELPRAPKSNADDMPRTRGCVYPEWDYRISAYRPASATVRNAELALGDAQWVHDQLARHRRTLREVRQHFSKLRPRRELHRRQPDGAAIDLDEFVAAAADCRNGLPMSERLYQHEQRARRDCAVLLLIDHSGSTDAHVAKGERIIDIEKTTLLLVANALAAVGDAFSIQAFSGEGPHNVRISELKAFGETLTLDTYRRFAALEPDRYTRLGAALRHGAASLGRQRAQRRLLIVISDGKPNDMDQYDGRYGVEDTRQAVSECLQQDLQVFCIVVDKQAPAYLSYVIGAQRFLVVRDIQRLPAVLLGLLRRAMR